MQQVCLMNKIKKLATLFLVLPVSKIFLRNLHTRLDKLISSDPQNLMTKGTSPRHPSPRHLAISIQTYLYKLLSVIYIKCGAERIAVAAASRAIGVTNASWIVRALSAETAPSVNYIVRRIRLSCPFKTVTC